jgi:hypothetical protein
MAHKPPPRPGARAETESVNSEYRRAPKDPADPFPPWPSPIAEATANVDEVVGERLSEVADAMANAQAAVSAAVADAQAAVGIAVANAVNYIAEYFPPFSPGGVQPLPPDPGSAQTPSDIATRSADQTMAAVDAQMSQIGVRPLDPAQQPPPGRTPYRRPPGR